jgi:PTH1 family peptidyl-tRNA hydrolase
MSTPIQLIIGLGNPGPEYEQTRHNAGAWLVTEIANSHHVSLRQEAKFKGLYGQFSLNGELCRLLIPTTFMNLSGQSVQALANFYKIPVTAMCVAHDELDLDPGTVRLKFDGGHGGHNGLRDIISHLHTNAFHRLRIGIGHPGHSKDVVDYVLKRPSRHDEIQIHSAINDALHILPDIIAGKMQHAMKVLHTK